MQACRDLRYEACLTSQLLTPWPHASAVREEFAPGRGQVETLPLPFQFVYMYPPG